MAWIYMHKNKINGKVYIGQTIQNNPLLRWRKNGKGYYKKGKSHFLNAIKKYGWDNFEHIIICKCKKEDLNKLEKYYIKKYNSFNPKFGYNETTGGSFNNNIRKTKKVIGINTMTFEKIEFDSAFAAANFFNLKYSSGITKCCKKKAYSCNGYYWCYADDYKKNFFKKYDEKQKQTHYTIGGLTIPVVCYNIETKEITFFDSIAHANSSIFKIDKHSAISSCCKNKTKIIDKKYMFCYKSDYKKGIFEKNKNKRTKLAVPIIGVNILTKEIKIFDSLKDASLELKISHGNISMCCQGKRKQAGGYTWKYKESV